MHPDLKAEVDKLIPAGFIREVQYPDWLANIILVKKKNWQIRVCIDFRVLAKLVLKTTFLFPNMDLLIDASIDYEALSFMDTTR